MNSSNKALNRLDELVNEIRADDSLRNLEVFKSKYSETENKYGETELDLNSNETGPAWFYWFCLPGCMPDSEPFGPFETETDALEDALENFGGCQ